MKVEQHKTSDLIPYANNAKKHDEAQIAKIASSIREYGFNNPVLIDGNKPAGIIAGHGRVMAAQKLGLEKVPCIRLEHLSEAQKRAYILADNRLAEIGGGWDMEMLKIELAELGDMDIDLEALGFGEDFLINDESGDGQESEGIDDTYTRKIVPPVYEPKGDCPPVADLYDRTKTAELEAEVEAAGLDPNIAKFLLEASQRHTVFHFARIAEFYCHQSPQIQDLMERNGLVIIDINKAIENGFVHLTERLGKLAELEEGAEDA